ncbi:MAG: DUF4270 family protein [Saprospiraceae bacterium]
MYKLSYLICGVFLLSIISACNEPGLIGSDLVEDEQVELFFTDTIHPQISTVRGDSVRIYAPSIATLDNYLFGNYNDPIFGNQNASLYFRLKSPEVNPDFDIANRIDSIVLILDIDSATVYGNALETFTAEIFALSEDLDNDEEYFSNSTFVTEPMPVAVSNGFSPGAVDSITIIEPLDGDEETVRAKNHWRIKFDNSFVQDFKSSDTSVFLTDSAFLEKYKGFYLKPSSQNNGLLSLDFLNSISRFSVYYHSDDTTFLKRNFNFERTLVSNFEADYAGSEVEPFLNSIAENDSLIFIQGMQGLEAKVTFPDKPFNEDIIISKAELELTIAELPNSNNALFTPPSQLMIYQRASDSTKVFIEDLLYVVNSSDFNLWFGGTPQKSGSQTKYTFNISAYLAKVWAGEVPKEVYIQVNKRWQDPSRVVFYGGNAQNHPAKINLYFSKTSN